MANKLKARLPKISMLLGVALFLLSSFSFWQDGNDGYALIFLAIGIINIIVARKNAASSSRAFQLVTLLNVVGASLVALDYQNSGTKGLHLVWWFAALMYVVSLIYSLLKTRKAITEHRQNP